MLRINEAARRLGVTPGTLRRWEEEGLINPDRTAGGERRYHEGELDQLIGRLADSRGVHKEKRRSVQGQRTVETLEREPDLEEKSATSEAPPPTLAAAPPPWERKVHEARADLEVRKIQREQAELERVEREAEQTRERERREAARRAEEQDLRGKALAQEEDRLQQLRDHGDWQAVFSGAPTEYKAAVTHDLSTFVNSEQFPPSLSQWRAQEYIKARVEQVLKPWREEKAKQEEAMRRKKNYESLLQAGLSHASSKTSSWDAEDRERVRRDVQRELREEVGAEWTRQEVIDLVEGILDDYSD